MKRNFLASFFWPAVLSPILLFAASVRAATPSPRLRLGGDAPGAPCAVVTMLDAGHVLEWHPDGSETNRFWASPHPDRLMYGWRNIGGEKTWIGPQTRWPEISANGDWPPPAFLEEARYELAPDAPQGSGTATIRTNGNTPVECVRTLSLAEDGTLAVQAAFRARPAPGEQPLDFSTFQIWSVAQLPVPLSATARLADQKRIDNGGAHGKDAIVPAPARDAANKTAFFDLANIRLPPTGGAKCFLDADAFVLTYPDGKMTVTQRSAAPLPEDELPCRAQLYCGGHPGIPGGEGRYVEVEFAGCADEPITVEFRWEPAAR